MSNTSDTIKAELTEQVIAFKNGDEAAFSRIYQLTGVRLLKHAMVITKDRSEAEDLLQDTLIEIIKSIKSLRDPELFITWSIRIMRNVFSHKNRKSHDLVARGDDDLAFLESVADRDVSYRPDIAAEKASVSEVVKAELDKLPEAQRTAMVAYYYDDLSVSEISEMMGVSENTTKSRLFAGRKAMKRGIEKYEQRTGVRVHEFTPASIIIEIMRELFADADIIAEVLKAVFAKVISETGIAATLPSLPDGLDVPEADADQVPDQATDSPEPDAQQSPDQTPDTPDTDAQQSPDQTPDTSDSNTPETDSQQAQDNTSDSSDANEPSESDAQQTQEQPSDTPESDTPDTDAPNADTQQTPQQPQQQPPQWSSSKPADTTAWTEPAPHFVPDEVTEPFSRDIPEVGAESIPDPAPAPRAVTDSHTKQTSHTAKSQKKADDAEHIARSIKKERDSNAIKRSKDKASIARKVAKGRQRALLLKLLATGVGILAIAGLALNALLPGGSSFLPGFFKGATDNPEKRISDYSRAYMSVLRMYEDDIREYTWQNYRFDASPSTTAIPSKQTALKDIDGDGVPELFFIGSVIADDSTRWYCADLHIFTFKDGKLQELAYDFEFPGEYSAEFYDKNFPPEFGYYTDHHGRMVDFATEPSSSYVVFTGKDAGSLYILCVNWGSEWRDINIRKYIMSSDGSGSTLTTVSDAVTPAIFDEMKDIVIYGGSEAGYSGKDEYDPDPEEKGWNNVIDIDGALEGDSIAPEKFQGCNYMTFDEIVALLQGQILDEPINSDEGEFDSKEAYARLTSDGEMQQAGDKLFRYDEDSRMLKYVKLGENDVRSIDLSSSAGWSGVYNGVYSDGTRLLYFGYGTVDFDSESVPLIKLDIDTGSAETLLEFAQNQDPNAVYRVAAVYDDVAYICYNSGQDKLWTVNLGNAALTEVKDPVSIRCRSGKYALAYDHSTLNALDIMPADIYELTGDGIKHVANLGSRVSVTCDLIDGRFYYAVCSDDHGRDFTVCRCNADGSNVEKLAHISGGYDYSISINGYTSEYCTFYEEGTLYKYTYETGVVEPMK